ncbi:unnamed protein product [Staurois parvus]|uniref:Uncharacterized protein n=1 Tax=Staurois parvus TaxID=386267 RepID=A0ABN9GDL2_9NEOB|nr:unnamed protein product [Staurois parvus]
MDRQGRTDHLETRALPEGPGSVGGPMRCPWYLFHRLFWARTQGPHDPLLPWGPMSCQSAPVDSKENPKFLVVSIKLIKGKFSNGDTSSNDLGVCRDFF